MAPLARREVRSGRTLSLAGLLRSELCSKADRDRRDPLRGSLLSRPAGFEPATYGLEVRCSIQLSYGRSGPSRREADGRSVGPAAEAAGAEVVGIGFRRHLAGSAAPGACTSAPRAWRRRPPLPCCRTISRIWCLVSRDEVQPISGSRSRGESGSYSSSHRSVRERPCCMAVLAG